MNRNASIAAANAALIALLLFTQASAEEPANELRVASPDGSIEVVFCTSSRKARLFSLAAR